MATVSITINDINLPVGMTALQGLDLLCTKWNYDGQHIVTRDEEGVITFEESKVNFVKRIIAEMIRDSLRGALREQRRAAADAALDDEVNEIDIVD